MKDCAGGQHPDDEPVTWREFDREMAHRAEVQRVKDESMQRAIDLRAGQLLLSHRLIVIALAVLTLIVAFYRR